MVVGNPGLDFFEQNGALLYVTEFADLITEYGRDKASKVAWAVYMVEDPNSPLFNVPIQDRIEEVRINYQIDVEEYEDFRKQYRRYAIPKDEQLFKIHMEKLDELTASINKLDLKKQDELKLYLQIMDKIPKIWNALEKVKQAMFEKKSTKVYGEGARTHREKRFG